MDGREYITIDNWDVDASMSEKAYKAGIYYVDSNEVDICFGVTSYGSHRYVIQYKISNFVSTVDDADIIYWNLFPNNFSAAPGNVDITIYSDFKYADLKKTIKQTREEGKDILFVILDEVLDPHNLGSVIRVAECAGATGVIISNRRSALVNETVVRTSAGATAYVPVVKVNNINQAIETLKEANVWVYALDMDGDEMYKTNLKGNIALVVGSEGNGVKQLTRKTCDGVISIPMFGQVNSLNASVSAGIAVYEVLRQRNGL
jgi:23S rRNA (guanosine2251-2'-O)-methyltransferase